MSRAHTEAAGWEPAVVDSFPVGLAQIDSAGRVVRANHLLAQLIGVSQAALPGTDLHDLTWPAWCSDQPGVSLLDRMLAGHPVDGIFTVTPISGPAAELRVRAVPRSQDRAEGSLLVLAAVPVSLASQHSVGREAEAYRLLGEHLADVMVVLEGPIMTWVSASAHRVLGYPPEALTGRSPQVLIAGQDSISGHLTPEQPMKAARRQLRHAAGHLRWFDVNAAGRFGPDGTLIAVYATARDVDDEVRLQAKIRASELRFRDALDASPDGFAIYQADRDDTGTVTGLRLSSINSAGAERFAADAGTLIGRDLLDIYPGAAANGLYSALIAALQTGRPQRARFHVDSPGWTAELDGIQVRLDDTTVMSTWRDVTDVVRGEQLLARAYEETADVRATLQTALDATSDGFVVFDLDRDDAGTVTGMRARHANASATAFIGMTPDDVADRDPRDVFPGFTQTGLWEKVLTAVEMQCPQHHRVHLADDTGEWTMSIDNTIAPVGEGRVALTFRDVTADERNLRENQQTRRDAEHAATHDALTGLPNRTLLHRRLTEALRDCHPGERVAVVFCDLDGFKQINDTYGHAAGDQVLQATAARLARTLRHHDLATRLAGDEFVLVLRHIPEGWSAGAFTTRVSDCLSEPLMVDGRQLTPRASLGVVIAAPPADHDTGYSPDELIAAADQAMYTAKAAKAC